MSSVISRSEATKQSMVQRVLPHGLLRYARNDGVETVASLLENQIRNPRRYPLPP
jgi:hypothetical protein